MDTGIIAVAAQMIDRITQQYQLMEVFLAGFALLGLLLITEILKRRDVLREEAARKTIHIGAGTLLATLPLYMGRGEIILTNFGFFIGVLLFAGLFHVFTAVHAVKRWTIGEFIYPLSTGLVALIFTDLRIYVFAVFMLAFADGLAGLIGRTFAKTRYRTLGGSKSWLGSSVFFGVAVVLVALFWWSVHAAMVPVLLLLAAALFMTVLEAGLAGGFDNFAVPLGASLVAQMIIAA